MGGMFHPTSKGIVDGRIKGLNNSVDITRFMIDNGLNELKMPEYYTLPGTEYYIGFGTGYELGQKLRDLLENDTTCKMPLDEKIECLSFLLKKQEGCRLILSTDSFLDNIKHWDEFNISKTVINDIQNLLKENKIQRAINKILIYLKDRFYLKTSMEFYPIYEKLINLREEKKKDEEFVITEELEKIKMEIQRWISLK
ncbi:hypothetical protein D1818_00930 [Aquimarina sp. BL5]|uniref:hypothetical protein n=1 Tax=Aquimarina sp. BL5 TaxID=1714860 RepID=UPI000E552992|nr:hypothetical protein [Aquimarina sp. BL5]AXT49450.1 hypothetical protein D1818_00930 [Aquimarina sp. BL5]RKM98415.1 hypothetical protein D7036_20110 [Aquimarina sp. BL5]